MIRSYTNDRAASQFLQRYSAQRLWEAVMLQAITDFVSGAPSMELEGIDPALREEYNVMVREAAEEWLMDEDYGPRRFRWVCAELNLEPDAVRIAVLAKAMNET